MLISARCPILLTLITLPYAIQFGSVARAQSPIPYILNGQATIEFSEGNLGGCGSPAQFLGPPLQSFGPGGFWIPSPSPTCSSGNCQSPSYSQAWPSQMVAPSYPSIRPYGPPVQDPRLQPRPIPSPTLERIPNRTDILRGPTREQNRNDRWTFEGPVGRILRLFLPLRHRSQDCS